MRLSVVILVLLLMSSLVVYSDKNNNETASVLELFPEFLQVKDYIKQLEKRLTQINDGISVLNKALECWIKCAETDGCTSASFQGGKCELSQVPRISYEVLEKAVGWNVFSKHTPVVSIHSQDYSLNLARAKSYCESLGLHIASYEDLQAAFLNGYEMCNCGWTSNGGAYIVMQKEHSGCMSSIGVIQCTWQSTWNVYCKPLKSD